MRQTDTKIKIIDPDKMFIIKVLVTSEHKCWTSDLVFRINNECMATLGIKTSLFSFLLKMIVNMIVKCILCVCLSVVMLLNDE